MEQKKGLTKQSLIAALTAAYVGAWLLFAVGLLERFQIGADARTCPIGSQNLTDLCTVAEISGAFLLVFVWALFALPFALALTVIPALALGRLSPILELKLDDPKLGLAQYSLGAAVGFVVTLLLAIGTDETFGVTLMIAGFVAGSWGVWAFRKARY